MKKGGVGYHTHDGEVDRRSKLHCYQSKPLPRLLPGVLNLRKTARGASSPAKPALHIPELPLLSVLCPYHAPPVLLPLDCNDIEIVRMTSWSCRGFLGEVIESACLPIVNDQSRNLFYRTHSSQPSYQTSLSPSCTIHAQAATSGNGATMSSSRVRLPSMVTVFVCRSRKA